MARTKKKKCCHVIDSELSTVRMLEGFMAMVVPDMRYGVCTVCGQSLKFIKNNTTGKEEVLKDVDDGGNKKSIK